MNLGPPDYESVALTAELQVQMAVFRLVFTPFLGTAKLSPGCYNA
nr:MAG TPA_asm: hypothetical protein [Bacteriophage sp.]